ncbi:MAG: hypothetical protein M4D80_20110 [Myxococcota bacterium]|nr:hypothetical protein [Myxococcota bacterium]
MRQLFSRLFDVLLGGATALLLIGSASESTDVASAKTPSEIPVESAYSAEVVEPPHPLVLADPRAVFLAELVAQGRHWRLDTDNGPVHIWVPRGYDAATAQTVVYVHGYWQDADAVWIEHRLAEQFAMSGINAMFVVPEAPRGKWDRVLWPTTQALLAAVVAGVGEPLPKGRVAVLGHSGAYRTVIQWLPESRLDTVVLLDAAYVDVMPYRDWVRGAKTRRFINVSIDTIRWSNWLHRWLPSTLTVEPFPRELTDKMKQARILYVKSDIGHWPLVTEGVAIPQMLRVLGAPSALEVHPALGLPSLELREPEIGQRAGDVVEQGS